MSVNSFDELIGHTGHAIQINTYGDSDNVWNVAIECEDCSEVLLDYDYEEVILNNDA